MDNVFTQLMDVFNWVVQSSIYAIVSIAVIALAQFAGRRRLPARWVYMLWLILLVRLVLPSGPESRLSLWNFVPQTVMEHSFVPSDNEVVTIISNSGTDAVKANAPPVSDNRAVNAREAISLIWLAGVMVMIAGIAVNNFRLWNSVRKLRQATDQPLLELFEDCKQLMRVRTVVGLVITDQVKSPSLFGCIRPRVLLPANLAGQIPREELRFIFLHELAHYKQGDIWVGWIVALVQSLHWFNPLVWWAFARMRADREVACDALALSRVNNDDGDRYGGALIGLLERFHHSRRLPVVAGILENKAQLKRRLNMITNFRHSTRREIIASAALLAVLSIALLTNPQTLPAQSGEHSVDPTDVIVVSINDIGQIAINGVELALSDLGKELQRIYNERSDKNMFIRVSQKVLYADVVNVGEIARSVGVEGIGLMGEVRFSQDDNEADGMENDITSKKPLRVGGDVMQSRLIHTVRPIYPEAARSAGESGTVVLNATIDEEGIVKEIAVASGSPLLIMSAVDAVRQWRYSPTLLDGVPIPVIAEVRVTFTLS